MSFEEIPVIENTKIKRPPLVTRLDVTDINHAFRQLMKQSEKDRVVLEGQVASLIAQLNSANKKIAELEGRLSS